MTSKYMQLIERCPLLPLESDVQHNTALKMMKELMLRDGKLSHEEIGYGKILAKIIQEWESAKIGDFFQKTSGNEALDFLLEENGMSQVEAAAIAGIPKQNLNAFLKGRRPLSKEARVRLGERFRVRPDLFEDLKVIEDSPVSIKRNSGSLIEASNIPQTIVRTSVRETKATYETSRSPSSTRRKKS